MSTTSRVELEQLVDWRAAFIAGLVAGLVFLIAEMLGQALIVGQSPWIYPHYTGALILGTDVLLDDISAISVTVTQLENSGVAPRTRREPGPNLAKEPSEGFPILDPAFHQSPRVEVAAPSQGDELLGKWPQLLRLGFGGDDPAVHEKTSGHVIQHGALVC